MIFKRADLQYFDIVAEKEGYLALIKTEELRLLQKKNSLLVFFDFVFKNFT